MMALMLFYTAIHVSVALSFLFWYFSGLVAAERMRLVVSATGPAAAHIATQVREAPSGRRAHA